VELTQEMLLSLAGVVTAIGGAWLTVRKISKDAQAQKKEHAEDILKTAREELAAKELALNARLNAMDTRIDSLESSVDKDLQHLRETYNGEIRNLGQKIEDLRSELRNQHTQMVSLLTKMIENSKE